MEKYLADTHALVWYAEGNGSLGPQARKALDVAKEARGIIYFSLISLMEMDYLVRRNKIAAGILKSIAAVAFHVDSTLQSLPVDRAVYEAFMEISPEKIPELPDRIVAAPPRAPKLI